MRDHTFEVAIVVRAARARDNILRRVRRLGLQDFPGVRLSGCPRVGMEVNSPKASRKERKTKARAASKPPSRKTAADQAFE